MVRRVHLQDVGDDRVDLDFSYQPREEELFGQFCVERSQKREFQQETVNSVFVRTRPAKGIRLEKAFLLVPAIASDMRLNH